MPPMRILQVIFILVVGATRCSAYVRILSYMACYERIENKLDLCVSP